MKGAEVFAVIALVVVPVAVQGVEDLELQEGAPDKKLISTFQIVRFPNSACTGSNSKNGTCYTSAECSDKSGTSSGSCADGFGVCCVFSITACGKSSAENITYWSTASNFLSTSDPTVCALDVMPISNNICQLRLDFKTFVISGPSTSTVYQGNGRFGTVHTRDTAANTNQVLANSATNYMTNCLTDQFTISGVSSANSPPMLCGTCSTQHMYVDANVDEGNRLQFTFSPMIGPAPVLTNNIDSRGISTFGARTWDLVVYQYECGHINGAPPGCTQYLWGPLTGKVTSYNYNAGTGLHLANQNQKICIRREKTVCWACFSHTNAVNNEFNMGGENGINNHFTYTGQPCGYTCEVVGRFGDSNGGNQCSSADCGIVPGAFVIADSTALTNFMTANTTPTNVRAKGYTTALSFHAAPPQIMGRGSFGIGIENNMAIATTVLAGAASNVSICTQHIPFQLTFKSDMQEGYGAANGEHVAVANNLGVNLNYELVTCT